MFGWFNKKRGAVNNSVISQGTTISLRTGFGFGSSSAETIPAYFAAIRVLTSSIAQLPFKVFESTANGAEERFNHPVYRLLHKSPNNFMTSFVWREAMMKCALAKGNGYSFIDRNNAGQPIGIYLLNPDAVRVFTQRGEKKYHVNFNTADGHAVNNIINDEDMIHILGPGSDDGLTGISALQVYARDVIDESVSARKLTSKVFKNGSFLGGTLEIAGNLTSERAEEIAKAFKNAYAGVDNSWRVGVLHSGAKFNPLQMNAVDAQLIEQIKFQAEDIARCFGVPPHMIGILDRATFSNIEHQAISFVQHSLMPWIKRIEQECDRKLFSSESENKFYTKLNVDGLLRGDYQTRMDGHSKAVNSGILAPNEVRAIEGFNRIEGGDALRVPVNTQPAVDENKKLNQTQ